MNHRNMFCPWVLQTAEKLNDKVGEKLKNQRSSSVITFCIFIQIRNVADDYILTPVLQQLPSTTVKMFQGSMGCITKAKVFPLRTSQFNQMALTLGGKQAKAAVIRSFCCIV